MFLHKAYYKDLHKHLKSFVSQVSLILSKSPLFISLGNTQYDSYKLQNSHQSLIILFNIKSTSLQTLKRNLDYYSKSTHTYCI